jgi:hypothetical protein
LRRLGVLECVRSMLPMRRPMGMPREAAAGAAWLSYTTDIGTGKLTHIDDEPYGQTREQPVGDAEENTQRCAAGGSEACAENPHAGAVG